MQRNPSSPRRRWMGHENSARSSIARACGATSARANSRATPRILSCSSVSPKSMASPTSTFDGAGPQPGDEIFLHEQEQHDGWQREYRRGGEDLVPGGNIHADERREPDRAHPFVAG